MAKLGEISVQIRGVSYKPEDLFDSLNENCVPLLRANNIQHGKIVLDDVVCVSKSKVTEKQYLKRGDILICTSSGSRELVGKAAFIEDDMQMTFGAFCKVVRPMEECKKYVGYFFQSPYYRRKIAELAAGANINNIRNEHIENLEIPLPALEEQRRIAAVLDKVTDLIDKRRQQLDKLDLLVKSRFVEMFGDPAYTSIWPTKKLGELGELSRGVSKHRPRNDPALLGGPYPLIQTGDVSNAGLYITKYSASYSELGLAQSRLWKAGTLCITIAANIAQTSILMFDSCFPDSVVGFVPGNETNSVFMNYWFSFFQKILEEQAPQVAQKNINLKILNDLSVIVPPSCLQEEFEHFVSCINKVNNTTIQSQEEMQKLRKALMQQYFG